MIQIMNLKAGTRDTIGSICGLRFDLGFVASLLFANLHKPIVGFELFVKFPS